MRNPVPRATKAIGLTSVATLGALAGWWWQNRGEQIDVEERTRRRLRAWEMR